MDYAYKLKLIMRIATKVMLFHCTVKALLWARNRIFDIQQTTTNRLQHFCWCCRVIQSSRLKLLYSKKLMCVSPFIFLKIIQRHKHILANFFDICIWCFSNLGNFFRRLYLDYQNSCFKGFFRKMQIFFLYCMFYMTILTRLQLNGVIFKIVLLTLLY